MDDLIGHPGIPCPTGNGLVQTGNDEAVPPGMTWFKPVTMKRSRLEGMTCFGLTGMAGLCLTGMAGLGLTGMAGLGKRLRVDVAEV